MASQRGQGWGPGGWRRRRPALVALRRSAASGPGPGLPPGPAAAHGAEPAGDEGTGDEMAPGSSPPAASASAAGRTARAMTSGTSPQQPRTTMPATSGTRPTTAGTLRSWLRARSGTRPPRAGSQRQCPLRRAQRQKQPCLHTAGFGWMPRRSRAQDAGHGCAGPCRGACG